MVPNDHVLHRTRAACTTNRTQQKGCYALLGLGYKRRCDDLLGQAVCLSLRSLALEAASCHDCEQSSREAHEVRN